MVAEIPKSKASLKQNRFEFKFPGSTKTYTVPLLKYIKPALMAELEELNTQQSIVRLLGEYYPKESLFEKFEDAEQFEWFMDQWTAASGVSLGESEDSSSS